MGLRATARAARLRAAFMTGPLERSPFSLVIPLALAPAVLAVALLGRVHPDEVYQFLEPAYARVHGYGILAWEWRVGLRNWAFPGLLAGLIHLAQLAGVEHPILVRAWLALPQALLHGGALLGADQFIRRTSPSERAARWALALFGMQGVLLGYAGRTLGEALSADLLVLGVGALVRREVGARWGVAAGTAFALAAVTRYGSLPAIAGAALALLVTRQPARVLLEMALGALPIVLGLAALDAATWGAPFHSLRTYFTFNVASDQAAATFGAAPATFYVLPLLLSAPLWLWPALYALWHARGFRAVAYPLLMAGLYGAALVWVPHKEARFLYPAIVLVTLAAVTPVGAWASRHRWLGPIALVASLATAFAVPDIRSEEFHAMVAVGRDDKSTGLLVVNEGLWGAGGYFYLGRRIPWTVADWPHELAFIHAMQHGAFNRAITFEERGMDALLAAGFRVEQRIGRETLLKR